MCTYDEIPYVKIHGYDSNNIIRMICMLELWLYLSQTVTNQMKYYTNRCFINWTCRVPGFQIIVISCDWMLPRTVVMLLVTQLIVKTFWWLKNLIVKISIKEMFRPLNYKAFGAPSALVAIVSWNSEFRNVLRTGLKWGFCSIIYAYEKCQRFATVMIYQWLIIGLVTIVQAQFNLLY